MTSFPKEPGLFLPLEGYLSCYHAFVPFLKGEAMKKLFRELSPFYIFTLNSVGEDYNKRKKSFIGLLKELKF